MWVENLKSVDINKDIIQSKLFKELKDGTIAGPFPHPPFENFCLSPLGLVPRKVPGELRLIHHLSCPEKL